MSEWIILLIGLRQKTMANIFLVISIYRRYIRGHCICHCAVLLAIKDDLLYWFGFRPQYSSHLLTLLERKYRSGFFFHPAIFSWAHRISIYVPHVASVPFLSDIMDHLDRYFARYNQHQLWISDYKTIRHTEHCIYNLSYLVLCILGIPTGTIRSRSMCMLVFPPECIPWDSGKWRECPRRLLSLLFVLEE